MVDVPRNLLQISLFYPLENRKIAEPAIALSRKRRTSKPVHPAATYRRRATARLENEDERPGVRREGEVKAMA